jgi:predicted RNase H-like HicB family nuclease
MSLTTIVEDYVIAALRHAVPETDADGTVGAWIPEIPGLVAFGADVHECARNLYGLLEEWVRTSLAAEHEMPVIDGIDLNTEAGQALASYHRDSAQSDPARAEVFADDAELEQAFRRHDMAEQAEDYGSSIPPRSNSGSRGESPDICRWEVSRILFPQTGLRLEPRTHGGGRGRPQETMLQADMRVPNSAGSAADS